MHVGTTNIVIAVACFILIILLVLVYSRSRQGDQRIVRAIEQTFLPLLSALLITLGVLFNTKTAQACTCAAGNWKYVAAFGARMLNSLVIMTYLPNSEPAQT